MRRFVLLSLLLLSSLVSAQVRPASKATRPARPTAPVAETSSTPYQKPPQAVLYVLNAAPPPQGYVDPTGANMVLATPVRYPAIADLSRRFLRLAGLRINPATNGPHLPLRLSDYLLKHIADGKEIKLKLPANANLSPPTWSPDGKHFAFFLRAKDRTQLWIADAQTGIAKPMPVAINGVMDESVDWLDDSRTVLVETVPLDRGLEPRRPEVPTGPNVQESSGRTGPVRTYEDLLSNAYDAAVFDFYATSQLALIDTVTGKAAPVGKPAIFDTANPSPDGKYILVVRVVRPYSYLHPVDDFPREIEVWDRTGHLVRHIASRPLADNVPIDGVPTGPRNMNWVPTHPATLWWAEALDNGDPRKKVPFRDGLVALAAPFQGDPQQLVKVENRFVNMIWAERDGFALFTEFERNKRWIRTFLFTPGSSEEPKLIWSRNQSERYKNPGGPMQHTLPNGKRTLIQSGDWIFLAGEGATPEGDRPFLRKFNLKTGQTEEIFRSAGDFYESPVAITPDGTQFITRRENPTEPPNYYLHTADGKSTALTNFADPAPQIRGIKKQLVTYKRDDGVDLSFTLYLPPDYEEGTRLPTLVWAYPLEFTGADVAGQVSGSTQRFTTMTGISHLFLLLQGYAILDNATMPVIGDPETVNNTYVEQIVASAKAAIDKAVAMGVTDRDRVAVGGHSYGAFMTANLLAHSDLFRAGIARSGAYNRTLTPFGFQSERRTFWEAQDVYVRMSPFFVANKIKEPILLIHGEADNNSGTFPIQSERMYQALRGNGGTVRYVTLPFEAHGYSARESVEHVQWEMANWLDKYVKNAPPRPAATAEK